MNQWYFIVKSSRDLLKINLHLLSKIKDKRGEIIIKQKDGYLQLLLHLVNSVQGLHLSITLNLNGSLVSGMMISSKEYQNKLIGSLKDSRDDFNIGTSVGDSLEDFFNKLNEAKAKSEDKKIGEYKFIHLIDARYVSPDGSIVPTEQGFLWRGKIDSIDGFTLAQLK